MRKIFTTSTGMSVWYISKNGISLNEGGKFLTFSFIRLRNDERGRWLLRFYIKMPFLKCACVFEAFINTRKISYK